MRIPLGCPARPSAVERFDSQKLPAPSSSADHVLSLQPVALRVQSVVTNVSTTSHESIFATPSSEASVNL